MVTHNRNPSIQQAEAGKSGVQVYPRLLRELTASLDYRGIPCLKTKKYIPPQNTHKEKCLEMG